MYPPSVGPMAGANTTASPYIAKPIPRCRGSKVSARIPCSLGASPPPPIPWSTRKKISEWRFGAKPQRKLLMVKSTTQDM